MKNLLTYYKKTSDTTGKRLHQARTKEQNWITSASNKIKAMLKEQLQKHLGLLIG